jgi:hypothetical protein
MTIHVLSAGRDLNLLKTRHEILTRQGCVVTSAVSTSDVVNQFFDGDYDLMVLCHSIPLEERRRVLGFAKHYRPSMVVIVVNDSYEFLHGDRLGSSELRIPPEPDALVRAVTTVFPQMAQSA